MTISQTILNTCRALMIDLPLSSFSMVRSISEQAKKRKTITKNIEFNVTYLYPTKNGDEVWIKFEKTKGLGRKIQVVIDLMVKLSDGTYQELSTASENLKDIAEDIREYFFQSFSTIDFHWVLCDVDGFRHDINDEVN